MSTSVPHCAQQRGCAQLANQLPSTTTSKPVMYQASRTRGAPYGGPALVGVRPGSHVNLPPTAHRTSEPQPTVGRMLARKDLPRTPASAPAVPAIDRIQYVLARTASPGTFATRHAAGANDIFFDVVGVGAIPLPLSHRTADKLRAVAKPARYGLRAKTLLDPRVRDTWEIDKRKIQARRATVAAHARSQAPAHRP